MASLGELVARMSLDIAQFTGALNKVEHATADAVRSMKKQFDSVGSSLASMAAGVMGAHAVLEQFNKAIERGSQLKEMSNAYGVGVAKLDELSLAMQLAGTDSETLEKQFKALAGAMVDATNPASKSAQVFKAMGVEITDASGKMKSMDEVYKESIKQLSAIEEPALRAAAAQQIFAKGGTAALKAAEELDESLAQAQKQIDAYGASSEETAAMSKKFLDSVLLIADGVQRMMLPIIKALLPVFEDFRAAMEANSKGGVELASAIGGALATAFRVFATGAIVLVGVLKDIGIVLGGTAAAATALFTDGFAAAGKIIDEMNKDVAANEDATRASAMAMMGLTTTTEAVSVASERAAVNQGKLKNALNETKDAVAKVSKELREAEKDYNAVLEMATAQQSGGGDLKLTKEFARLNQVMADSADNAEMVGLALQYVLDQTGDGVKYMKAYNDELNKADDDLSKFRDELVQSWADLQRQNDELQDQVAVLGKVGVERDLELSRMERRRKLATLTLQDDIDMTNKLYDQRDALIAAKDAGEQYNETMRAMGSAITSGLDNLLDVMFKKTDKGFKGIWDNFKDWAFSAFKEIASRQVVVALLGSAAAGPAGASTNMLNMLTGGGGSGGGITGILSGLFGGGSSAAESAAGFMGPPTSLLGSGGVAGMVTSMLPAMGPIMAAVPYVGIAMAVASMFMKQGGGPKSGGFGASDGFPGGRYYTPSDADASAQRIVDATQTGYDQMVKLLGGSGGASFALGFDTDPKGTAGNRITSGVFAGGKQVYGVTNLAAGKDDAALQAALTTESKRSLLAALQASDLPSQIAKLLNSLVPATATDKQIDDLLAVAQAVGSMNEALAGLADPMTAASEALATANQTALDGWEKQRDALYDLANEAPETADGLNAVSQATAAFAQSTVALLAGIMAAKKQLDDMFASTRETIETAGMSPDALYAREQAKAEALFAQLQTATDPEQISRIAQQLDESINKAFGMLSPEEQAAKQQEFLDGLDRVQTETTARLDASMATISAQAETDRQFMQSKLDDILTSIESASAAFSAGADSLAGGVDVNIHVQDDRLVTEVTG